MNTTQINEVEINGTTYVRKDSVAEELDGMPYVVVRSGNAGCHAGYLKEENGVNITLISARRLWYWSGAASLSQLAMDGVSKPDDCKFPKAVSEITIYGCCEKIPATKQAQKSIEGVKEWKA